MKLKYNVKATCDQLSTLTFCIGADYLNDKITKKELIQLLKELTIKVKDLTEYVINNKEAPR